MAWSTPKTDWDTDDVIATTDLNRIEENTKDIRFNGAANGRIGSTTIGSGVGQTSVVNNTSITAATLIMLSNNSDAYVTGLRVSARSAGASFTIKTESTDSTATIVYMLMEPQ